MDSPLFFPSTQSVMDIEEAIWAPKFGLKGMLDATVELVLRDVAHASAGGAPPELAIAPLEIKTGRPHDSHRAQVLLYLLLLEARYGGVKDWGLLWNTQHREPTLVPRRRPELAALLAVRNRLAAHLGAPGGGALAPMV